MNKAMALLAAAAFTGAVIPQAAWAADDGKNRVVVLENLSSQAIYNLFASPITSKNWEEDLLGDRTVAAGESLRANIDNGTNECIYDLKVVMANGKEHIQREVNVCAASKWAIGDTGNSIQ